MAYINIHNASFNQLSIIVPCIAYAKPILKMKLNISDNGLKDVYDFDDSSMYPSAMNHYSINGV